jgi:Bacterial SH3 domain
MARAVRAPQRDPDGSATRSLRSALGEGAEVPLGRLVLLLVLAIAVGAFWLSNSLSKAAPSEQARDLGSINPRALLGGDTSSDHFLPTPVAALPAETAAGPPAPAAADPDHATAPGPERVKVVNTGGLGALLRAEPPKGRFIQSLRDGQELEVLEHRDVGGEDWLRVRTQAGVEGWVFGRLVGPAQ